MLTRWERMWAAEVRMVVRQDGEWSECVTRAARFLGRWLSTILEHDCGPEFAADVCGGFRRGVSMIRDGPLRSLLLYPCGWCGRRCLMQEEGLPMRPWFTRCVPELGGCGRVFTESELEWQAQVRMLTESREKD